MHNKDNNRFDDQCRRAFDFKQEAHLRWTLDRFWVDWEEFFRCQVRVNETKPTQRQRVGLVSERMFLRMPNPLISCGPLLSLLCLT